MRTILLDVETSPNIGYTWGKYEQNVIEFTKESYLLSFSIKELGKGKCKTYALPDFKLYKKKREDDTQLLKKLWDYLNEADIVIGHNLDRFDIRKANAYFIEKGLKPPRPYKTVDTLKVARRYFAFNSNKLDDLGKHLHLGKKVATGGFGLWKGCLEGNMASWRKMKAYNAQDVLLLEKVYQVLLPWIQNHPHVDPEMDEFACSNCGSQKIHKRGYEFQAGNKKRHKYQCQSCGHWFRGKLIKE